MAVSINWQMSPPLGTQSSANLLTNGKAQFALKNDTGSTVTVTISAQMSDDAGHRSDGGGAREVTLIPGQERHEEIDCSIYESYGPGFHTVTGMASAQGGLTGSGQGSCSFNVT